MKKSEEQRVREIAREEANKANEVDICETARRLFALQSERHSFRISSR